MLETLFLVAVLLAVLSLELLVDFWALLTVIRGIRGWRRRRASPSPATAGEGLG
jgi:hypothetical protein